MGFPLYLAMTAAEIAACQVLPPKLAYMACHFSAYGTGLSNFPDYLSENALLILNDRTPVCGHDPQLIATQLQQVMEAFSCSGVLLDLQRPGNPETDRVVDAVVNAMAQPVAVSEYYAANRDCPVFLSPPPLRMPLKKYLAPWQGREIWLEAAPDAETVTVTGQGSQVSPLPLFCVPEDSFVDKVLHCRYQAQLLTEQIKFHVERNGELLKDMLEEATDLGVTTFVGLHQLLHEGE